MKIHKGSKGGIRALDTFDPSQPTKTRDGREVVVLSTTRRGTHGKSIVGLVRGADTDSVLQWFPNGRYESPFGVQSATDLVNFEEAPATEPTFDIEGLTAEEFVFLKQRVGQSLIGPIMNSLYRKMGVIFAGKSDSVGYTSAECGSPVYDAVVSELKKRFTE